MDVRAEVVASPNGKLYFLFSRDGLMQNEAISEAVDKIIEALGLQEGDQVNVAFTKVHPRSGQVQPPDSDYQSLNRLQRAKGKNPMTPLRLAALIHDTYERLAPKYGHNPAIRGPFRPASPNGNWLIAVCQEVLKQLECDHSEVTVILADVSPDRRMEIGQLAGVDYSLGPGSARQIPLTLCLKCGKVQYKPLPHPEGSECQHCSSSRPFYLVPSNNDAICGILEICLDCGMVQGNWPYPKENR